MSGLKIVAFAGGVGGAKLADGLALVIPPQDLVIIVNTADDFTHLGFNISPDIDTVCYTLAGLANHETGWGQKDETWNVFEHIQQMGMPDWFKLGDADIATHIVRSNRLLEGWPLSKITAEFCRIWGIQAQVLPMSNDVVRTLVYTDRGDLEFQEYFVHQKCQPLVKGFNFIGVEQSKPAPGVVEAIENTDAIVICPSNPWVSIDPILSVPNIRGVIEGHYIIAVSPIIGNQAVKGPAAKMFTELGFQPSAFAVAEHYAGIIDGIVIDNSDEWLAQSINTLSISTFTTDILMRNQSERGKLAQKVIDYISAGIG